MTSYRVKDWSEFQHYKDRSPPWIRLHKRLLDNFRFHSLPDASRALAPMLWLLASENDDLNSGVIDGPDEEIAFRLRRTVEEFRKAIKPLTDKGFIEVVQHTSNLLAERKQVATPETEVESKEAETDSKKGEMALDFDLLVRIWNDTAGEACPKVAKLIDSRKKAVRCRMADTFYGSVEKWKEFCLSVQNSAFLTGKNDRGWTADFDWVLQQKNTTKIMEGKYADHGRTPGARPDARHAGFDKQDYYAGTEGFDVT